MPVSSCSCLPSVWNGNCCCPPVISFTVDHCIVQYAKNQEVFTLELVNVYCFFNYSHDFGMDVAANDFVELLLQVINAMN